MVGFDYGNKKIKVAEPFYPGKSIVDDFKKIIEFFSTSTGINPERGVNLSMFETMLPELEKNFPKFNGKRAQGRVKLTPCG